VDRIPTGNADVDGTFSAEYWDIARAEKGNVDRHVLDAREQTSVLTAKAHSGLTEDFRRVFGQPTLTGNSESKVIHSYPFPSQSRGKSSGMEDETGD
jgi:hypothetical protein